MHYGAYARVIPHWLGPRVQTLYMIFALGYRVVKIKQKKTKIEQNNDPECDIVESECIIEQIN
jgi:hypothetical protein